MRVAPGSAHSWFSVRLPCSQLLVSPLGDPPAMPGRLATFDSYGSMTKGSSS